jgi:hypothetical protein
MDATPLVRLRWRLRGAWLWPSFVLLSFADAAILHDLPPSQGGDSLLGGWLLGAVLSLIGIALLSGPLGVLVRRLRPDMPRVVARNYAGALIALAVTLAFLAAGLVNQRAIANDNAALEDAVARAENYIGTRAPAEFQRDLRRLDVSPIQAPQIYRVCASNLTHTRHYCVVVDRSKPFGRSVRYSGSESNAVLSQGTS